jgi:hypothetical protein
MEISWGQAAGFNSEERHEVGKIINLCLDQELRYAISVFCNPPTAASPRIARNRSCRRSPLRGISVNRKVTQD